MYEKMVGKAAVALSCDTGCTISGTAAQGSTDFVCMQSPERIRYAGTDGCP